jgi:hypothetical protein
MKRRIGIMGFALVVVLALSGLAVSFALAAEPTKILPEPTPEDPITAVLTQEAEGHLLTVGGLEVKCKKGSGSESWTSPNLGTFKVLFTECKGPLKTVCTGTGDPEGLIAAAGIVHFWLALNMYGNQKEPKSELVGALVFLVEAAGAKFTCKSATLEESVVVHGCVAAHVLPESLNGLVSKVHEEFEEWLTGETSILSVLPEESTKEIPCLPTSSTNGGAEELAALEGLVWVEKFIQNNVAITIDLMNP